MAPALRRKSSFLFRKLTYVSVVLALVAILISWLSQPFTINFTFLALTAAQLFLIFIFFSLIIALDMIDDYFVDSQREPEPVPTPTAATNGGATYSPTGANSSA